MTTDSSRCFVSRRFVVVLVVALVVPLLTAGVTSTQVHPTQASGSDLESLCGVVNVEQFSDVAADDYGAAYILCAKELDLTRGYDDGTYGSNNKLTRGQMAAFLARLWRDVLRKHCPTQPSHSFTDVTGSTFETDIACIYALGVAKGTTTYAPNADLTTAQITRLVARLLNKAMPNSCDLDRSDELQSAAECLVEHNIAPTTVEARSTQTATRAQMAVYLVGVWHHTTGRGRPPTPPTTTGPVTDIGSGDLLDRVLNRGTLNCGVSGHAVAFSEVAPDGSITGFDVDYCRSVAAALFGNADAVDLITLSAAERFTALQTGDVDLLMRNTTWTQSRDTQIGLSFGPTTYYDGQQFMARTSDGFSTSSQINDLTGATVCTVAGTSLEENLKDAVRDADIDRITINTYSSFGVVMGDFVAGVCDVITTDGSALAARRVAQQPSDQAWVIFPSIPISREPLGPVYLQNEVRFADVVNWTVYATIIADDKGITSSNVDVMAANPPDNETARLLGGEDELQSGMGLASDAFLQVIKQVGNYNEIYSRNLNPVGLTREGTLNANWRNGGLIYAPPAR
ncbi:MAG: transporter substrate-binding domain-containing protein [Acidimicrobiaceae bacterium]|nr:transporter substrate-binding domain-containing protein [Acidimicrobiaceae bacterium]